MTRAVAPNRHRLPRHLSGDRDRDDRRVALGAHEPQLALVVGRPGRRVRMAAGMEPERATLLAAGVIAASFVEVRAGGEGLRHWR
jgi:hypothetical protein